jgi:hypothetical protein
VVAQVEGYMKMWKLVRGELSRIVMKKKGIATERGNNP